MQSFPWIYDEDDAFKANAKGLRRASDAGIESLIDLTPLISAPRSRCSRR